MSQKFTKAFVDGLKPQERSREVMDPLRPGFGIKVHPTGRKTWIYRYRTPGGTLRRISLGAYAEGHGVSLTEARNAYLEQRKVRELHGDPLAVRQEKRVAARAIANHVKKQWTVKVLIDNHIRESRVGADKKRSWAFDKQLVDRDLPSSWLTRPADSITREEVKNLHARIAERAPRVAALFIAALRKAYNRAIDDGVLERNPCARIKTAKAKQRERYLSKTELKKVLSRLDVIESAYAEILHLILWTAGRRQEVVHMRWAELDLELGLWRLPGERTKNGRSHEVMLPSQAKELLTMRRTRVSGKWVFPSPRFPDRAIRLYTATHAIKRAIPNWGVMSFTIHDLRRTAATHLTGEFGCPRRVLEVILNHVDRSVTGIYDRHLYQTEARAYLQQWADLLDELTVGEPERSP